MNYNDESKTNPPQSEQDLASILWGHMDKKIQKEYHKIGIKLNECVGISDEQVLNPGLKNRHYDAVVSYHRAMSADNSEEKKSQLEWCAEAAGEYVKESIMLGEIDNLPKLFKRLDRIRKGKKPRSQEVNERVGCALLTFLESEKRLPKNRDEFRHHSSENSNDISDVSPRSLSLALSFYELNEKIRDKTGPKAIK